MAVASGALADLAGDLLRDGRPLAFTAAGRSMAPAIRHGETVRVEPLRRPPARGEVVLCRAAGGRLLLHRVLRRTAAGVLTRGDAASEPDEPCAPDEVLGRVVTVDGRPRLHLGRLVGSLMLCRAALRRTGLLIRLLRPLARALCALAARA